MKQAWRHAALAGFAAGVAVSPAFAARPVPARTALVVAALAAAALALAGPRRGPAVAIAALAGLGLGGARLAAIDGGALRGPVGAPVELEGQIASVPRLDGEGHSAELETARGRVLLRASGLDELGVGAELRARGHLSEPEPWRARSLRRRGIALAVQAERIEPTGRSRGGLEGRIDVVRERAELALERGMPEREAALARGFVLGEDDRIDPGTRQDFRRSGLAHLLAVSGQNVVLLCLLAWPLLALCGLTLRARLLVLLALIAVYVPVTGAGASIQRAAVMGAAGLVAALADRPGSRWYALLLAAAVTLGLNPRACGDVGWQLSFAAVAGILLWTGRLTPLLAGGDGDAGSGPIRRAAAEGVAMTVAATVATAPLMAHHFEALSIAALPANVLALPAVAPAMWLGMLAGIAGQVPSIPVEPLNWLNSLCLAYISQIARWFGSPGWAQIDLRLESPAAVAAAYAVLLTIVELGIRAARRRRGLGVRSIAVAGHRSGARRVPRVAAIALALAAAVGLLAAITAGSGDPAAPDRLVVRVLDVGQGDSILLDPPGGEAILVDTGPAEAEVGEHLRDLGVRRLAAVAITHDQSDHAGGLAEVMASVAVDRLVLARPSPHLTGLAAANGAEPLRVAEGGELRSGGLRISVLWPPPEMAGAFGGLAGDPNLASLVLLAEWRHFSILLTGDAEAEAAPVDPGPVDVLKVAHHGSADEGLGPLLDHAAPKLAVISVGDGNPYGHPAEPTMSELAEHGVEVVRTDDRGEVVIEADEGGWWVSGD